VAPLRHMQGPPL